MALYHLSVKTVQRSKGRSATAAAAYRAGALIVDERTRQVHDYTRRGGVVSAEIVLPAGAAPALADRTALWNAAEWAEKRKDGTPAREYEVALPVELSAEQRRDLVRAFAQALAQQHGVAVDAAIHLPDREGDQRNHHAHVLTTTRIAGPDGLGAKAEIEKAGRSRRADVEAVRELWEGLANAHLEQAGREERVSRRSLAEQGVDRRATIHMGPVAMDMERQGKESDRGDINREIQAENAERRRLVAEIIDLKAERDRRADQARWEAMPLPELRAEEAKQRPLLVEQLVARLPAAMEKARQAAEADQEAKEAAARIRKGEADLDRWQQQHRTRAFLHAKGVWRYGKVGEMEGWLEQQRTVRDGASARKAAAEAEIRARQPAWQQEVEPERQRLEERHGRLLRALRDREARMAQDAAEERAREEAERALQAAAKQALGQLQAAIELRRVGKLKPAYRLAGLLDGLEQVAPEDRLDWAKTLMADPRAPAALAKALQPHQAEVDAEVQRMKPRQRSGPGFGR